MEKIIWTKTALKQIEYIHTYLTKESKSISIANKVVTKIFDSTMLLNNQPELYKLDIFKSNNYGTYRAYQVISYRITYRLVNKQIRILRVRHSSRIPFIH